MANELHDGITRQAEKSIHRVRRLSASETALELARQCRAVAEAVAEAPQGREFDHVSHELFELALLADRLGANNAPIVLNPEDHDDGTRIEAIELHPPESGPVHRWPIAAVDKETGKGRHYGGLTAEQRDRLRARMSQWASWAEGRGQADLVADRPQADEATSADLGVMLMSATLRSAECQPLPGAAAGESHGELETTARLTVNIEHATATLEGECHALSVEGAAMLHHLKEARGGWVTGPEMRDFDPPVSRADRVRKNLPGPLQTIIEPGGPRGFRLNL